MLNKRQFVKFELEDSYKFYRQSLITPPGQYKMKHKRDYDLLQCWKYGKQIIKKNSRNTFRPMTQKTRTHPMPNQPLRQQSCHCSECGTHITKTLIKTKCYKTGQQLLIQKRNQLRISLIRGIQELVKIIHIQKCGIVNFANRIQKKVLRSKKLSDEEKLQIQFFKKQFDVDIYQMQTEDPTKLSTNNLESPNHKRRSGRTILRIPNIKQTSNESTPKAHEQFAYTNRTRSNQSIYDYIKQRGPQFPELNGYKVPITIRSKRSESQKRMQNTSPYLNQNKYLVRSISIQHHRKN